LKYVADYSNRKNERFSAPVCGCHAAHLQRLAQTVESYFGKGKQVTKEGCE